MKTNRRVLCVIMDGIGVNSESFGNAVYHAYTPHMDLLAKNQPFNLQLKAHGQSVGLPSDQDMGNSEVGHNTLGAGRVYEQGAKLVEEAIANKTLFEGKVWKTALKQVIQHNSSLHFIGLLSDGKVHSHEEHLYALMAEAKKSGVKKIRLHLLLDGRDVAEKSAEIYAQRLAKCLAKLNDSFCSIKVASAGGRMSITMDRYMADWNMVQLGWKVHVLAEGPLFPSLEAAIAHYRQDKTLTDQIIPGFVVGDAGKPNGPILDRDSVILFNFRGDRAIEISRAFTEESFSGFERQRCPKVFYAGMMQYDGDLSIPKNFLVSPPHITHTLGEYLAEQGKRQFACSETQKYGHVTYFWNGNRSTCFNIKTEEYREVSSDNSLLFVKRPWMRAQEVTDIMIEKIEQKSFDFARVNYANGDMVGHTGNFFSTCVAVATVDLMLGRLIQSAQANDTILLITADHGNCEEMFEGKGTFAYKSENPVPKTSHTLNPVPLYVFDPRGYRYKPSQSPTSFGLSNIANTILFLMGETPRDIYDPSILESI